MKRLSLSNTGGFTLVELMVAMAVTSLLIVVILGFLTNSLVTATRESARSDLLFDAQNTLDTLSQGVRTSSNAYEETSLPDDNAPSVGWASDDNTLVLATAALDSNKQILFADALRYTSHKNNTIYFVQDGVLYRRILAANVPDNVASTSCPAALASSSCPADSTLARNVRSFSIRYFDGNGDETDPNSSRSIEATLVLEVERFGQMITATYGMRSVFRNQ